MYVKLYEYNKYISNKYNLKRIKEKNNDHYNQLGIYSHHF